MPAITVVIPTLDRGALLVRLLRSLLEQVDESDAEVLVVDQSDRPDEGVLRFLDEHQARFRCLRPSFKSLTRARNLGARESRSDLVLYVDDDNRIGPGLLRAHLDAHRRHAPAAVTGPLLLSGQTRLIRAEELPPGKLEELRAGRTTHFHVDFMYPATQANGCNMSYQRSWIDRCGGFDENFRGSFDWEDFEFSHRLRRAGGRILYVPEAWVVYEQGESGGCRRAGADLVRSKAFNNTYAGLRTERPAADQARLIWGLYRGYVLNKSTLLTGAFVPLTLPFLQGLWQAHTVHQSKGAPSGAAQARP